MYGNRIKDMGQRQDQGLNLREANMELEDDLMKCTLQPFLFLVVISQEKKKKFMMIRVEHTQVINTYLVNQSFVSKKLGC